ncbi:MAG: Slp family lipoprotein [Nitrospirae bacterium]|nr:Slp family lipoprotein [Nitrospirota bacterium]
MRWLLLGLVLLSGCASPGADIPKTLDAQIDKTVTFPELLQNPDSYIGKTVVVGGEVLSAKRQQEGTRLQVLQLPLDDSRMPAVQRTSSQGRFLALEKSFLDPATFSGNPRVTIVGEVTGTVLGNVDEVEYAYPSLVIKHLHVWEPQSAQQEQGFGIGLGLGGGIGIGTGF